MEYKVNTHPYLLFYIMRLIELDQNSLVAWCFQRDKYVNYPIKTVSNPLLLHASRIIDCLFIQKEVAILRVVRTFTLLYFQKNCHL